MRFPKSWKILLLPALLWAPAGLLGQEFLIRGKLSGLAEKAVVSLSDANTPSDTLARGTVRNGEFSLRGTVREPNLFHLNLPGATAKTVLFIGNEEIQVSGTLQEPDQLRVSGSAVHADFEAFKRIFTPLFDELNVRGRELQSTPGIREDDARVQTYMDKIAGLGREVDRFVKERPSSPVSAFVLVVTGQMEPEYQTLQDRYAQLDKSLQEGFFGRLIRDMLAGRAGEVGAPAIEFTQDDPEGRPVALSSFRGRYVLVDFWASWCGPCRQENPNLVRAYHQFKNSNFTVLGVSLDNNRQHWLRAIKADKLDWTQVSDLKGWSNAAAALYKVQSIPQNILIDPDGKIIAKNLRGPELHSRLSELLRP